MNELLQKLQPYPFEKLNALKAEVSAPANLTHIALSIGEPKHPAPPFVAQRLSDEPGKLSIYPSTKGLPELREAAANWAARRFKLNSVGLNPDTQVLPVNGTREALFAFAQAAVTQKPGALVVCPNPFYQIYEGAAFLAGAEPYLLNCTADNSFIPRFDQVPEAVWERCQLLFICTPGNPTGSVHSLEELQQLIELADRHDFIIASDECYSEIYFDEDAPPPGLLQACEAMGRTDYSRCVIFHSLSKRSNLPGLRSGFVAGDAKLLEPFLLYRTYHGCAMAAQVQLASIDAWNDEEHVRENRRLYQQKFDAVLEILGDSLNLSKPEASFYLWAETPIPETEFAQRLFAEQNITVLPGSYLGRESEGINPGSNRVRMALVATVEECVEAAQRIKQFVETL